jgi:hypothetical protein
VETPLQNQMRLIACRLSGEITKVKEFREMQSISYLHLGEEVRRSNMQHTSVNGFWTIFVNNTTHLYHKLTRQILAQIQKVNLKILKLWAY